MTTLAEMYVQGVSTRKVKAITEELCGIEISAMQVSRATAQLDEVLQEWRERPLGEITYLYVDARYEKVREAGQVRDAAVLVASGITPEGERQVLGVSVSLSEHETHWKAFLTGLKDRGLNGVKLVISDDHAGLGAARRAVFGQCSLAKMPVSPAAECWCLCAQTSHADGSGSRYPVHVQCPRSKDRRGILYKLPSRNMLSQLQDCRPGWKITLQKGLRCLIFLWNTDGSIRTTNSLERINKEIRRRTRVVGVFPNEASCLRLVSALLMEISEEWQIGKHYCAGKSFNC